MMQVMRTTLTIDDTLASALQEAAHRSGKSFQEIVNEILRAGLAVQQTPPPAQPYRVKPASLGGVMPGLDLDKALALADALEEMDIARHLQRPT